MNPADIQLISKFNKGFGFSLFVVDIFSKYAWDVPLKDKKVIAMVNLFEKVLDKSDCKSNKIWFDQGSEFYNKFLKNGYKIMKCK